jgi:hypothetical protein
MITSLFMKSKEEIAQEEEYELEMQFKREIFDEDDTSFHSEDIDAADLDTEMGAKKPKINTKAKTKSKKTVATKQDIEFAAEAGEFIDEAMEGVRVGVKRKSAVLAKLNKTELKESEADGYSESDGNLLSDYEQFPSVEQKKRKKTVLGSRGNQITIVRSSR